MGAVAFNVLMIRQVADECPAGKECTSSSFIGVTLCCIVLMVTAILGLLGVKSTNTLFMRIANVIFIVFSFILLLLAIVMSMASGLVSDINSYYDDNWPAIRAELDVNNYCDAKWDDILDPDPLHDPCKPKIQAETEDNAATVVVISAVVIGVLAAAVYFNQRSMEELDALLNDTGELQGQIDKAKGAVKAERTEALKEKKELEQQLAALKAS